MNSKNWFETAFILPEDIYFDEEIESSEFYITTKDNKTHRAVRLSHTWFTISGGFIYETDVIAWVKLPRAYKGGSHAN